MAPRRNRQALAVSLFPFLSVLACVIGTLTLLIAALAFTQIASETHEFPAAEPEQALASLIGQDTIRQFARRLEELSSSLSEATTLKRQLDALTEQLEQRGIPLDLAAEDLDVRIAMLVELESVNDEIASQQRDVARLHANLKNDYDRLKRSRELPNDAPIALMPSGSGSSLAPYFVECRADGVRIRRKNRTWSEELHLRDIVERGRFKIFLEKVRAVHGATAIFLVRPDAVATYNEAKKMADRVYARHGKLPIPGEGPIDLRLVELAAADSEGGDP